MKKAMGVVMYFIIITSIFFGCMNLKTHVGKNKVENYYTKAFDKKYKKGMDNFVYLAKLNKLELGCEVDDPDPMCQPIISSTASGVVLSSYQNSIFVLTAAHFCKKEVPPGVDEKIIGFPKDREREFRIIKMDEKIDACLLMGIKFKNEKFNQIKLASKDPVVGSDVYTVAAPNGIGGPGFRLVFTGKFGGCDSAGCMTTIPATFGSSGAAIYTKDGELITIVMAVSQGFENLILSPPREELYKFILNIDSEVDIYPY